MGVDGVGGVRICVGSNNWSVGCDITIVASPCAVMLVGVCECSACEVDPFSAGVALNGSTCASIACYV